MSSYQCLTQHPETEEWEMADWIDNYYGLHHYGVVFSDGEAFDPREMRLLTKDSPNEMGVG